jgi:hypothetical protein
VRKLANRAVMLPQRLDIALPDDRAQLERSWHHANRCPAGMSSSETVCENVSTASTSSTLPRFGCVVRRGRVPSSATG